MKITQIQISCELGRFDLNAKKIIEKIELFSKSSVDVLIFPEAVLFGYQPLDLLEQAGLVNEQWKWIQKIHFKVPKGQMIVLGALSLTPGLEGKPYQNSAVVLLYGEKPRIIPKSLLPSYDYFDETRFFEPGKFKDNLIQFKGKTFFIGICEDFWFWLKKGGRYLYGKNPLEGLKLKKPVDVVLHLNASPFHRNKLEERILIAQKTSQFFKAPLFYTNLVGGQDELLFDGGSFFMPYPWNKKNFYLMSRFEEDSHTLDLYDEREKVNQRTLKNPPPHLVFQALVMGIRDFVLKCGLEKVHLGLSGGIDSAVVAVLAQKALGSSKVTAIALPGPFNSPESLKSAKDLAKKLKINFIEIPINETYQSFKKTVETAFEVKKFGLIHENLQARCRGVLLMAYGNKVGSLLLNTSNKTELAVGYSTLYGDLCGGLSPLGDLLKNEVYELAKEINSQEHLIPEFIIERPPSAELRPNQKDEDHLLPYAELDKIVEKLVVHCVKPRTQKEKEIHLLLSKSEFKRWQSPPILRVSSHGFGLGRRWPLAKD